MFHPEYRGSVVKWLALEEKTFFSGDTLLFTAVSDKVAFVLRDERQSECVTGSLSLAVNFI